MFSGTAKHGTRNGDVVGIETGDGSCEKLLPCGSRYRMIEGVLRDTKEAEQKHQQDQPDVSIAHTCLLDADRIPTV